MFIKRANFKIVEVNPTVESIATRISKIASKLSDVLTDTEYVKILGAKTDDDLFFLTRAMTAETDKPRPNQNGDRFPAEELRKSYKTFIGKNLFLNHNSSDVANAVGKIAGAWYIDEDKKDEHIVCLCRVSRKCEPKLAMQIEAHVLEEVSMGCSCEICVCGVCGRECKSANDFCDHLKNLGHMITSDKGERIQATSINKGITFNELSLVSEPADSSARMISVYATEESKGIEKNASTESITTTDDISGYDEKKLLEMIPSGSYSGVKNGDITVIRDGTNEIKFVWRDGKPILQNKDITVKADKKGTYTGKIVNTPDGEFMIGRVVGNTGDGKAVYATHEFDPLNKFLGKQIGELNEDFVKKYLKQDKEAVNDISKDIDNKTSAKEEENKTDMKNEKENKGEAIKEEKKPSQPVIDLIKGYLEKSGLSGTELEKELQDKFKVHYNLEVSVKDYIEGLDELKNAIAEGKDTKDILDDLAVDTEILEVQYKEKNGNKKKAGKMNDAEDDAIELVNKIETDEDASAGDGIIEKIIKKYNLDANEAFVLQTKLEQKFPNMTFEYSQMQWGTDADITDNEENKRFRQKKKAGYTEPNEVEALVHEYLVSFSKGKEDSEESIKKFLVDNDYMSSITPKQEKQIIDKILNKKTDKKAFRVDPYSYVIEFDTKEGYDKAKEYFAKTPADFEITFDIPGDFILEISPIRTMEKDEFNNFILGLGIDKEAYSMNEKQARQKGEWGTFKITLQHGNGIRNIYTVAPAKENAIRMVLISEGAPESAIKAVEELTDEEAREINSKQADNTENKGGETEEHKTPESTLKDIKEDFKKLQDMVAKGEDASVMIKDLEEDVVILKEQTENKKTKSDKTACKTRKNLIKRMAGEDLSYEQAMQLDVNDPKLISWLAKAFGVLETTVSEIASVSGNAEDLYADLSDMADSKGYGWDQIAKDEDEEDGGYWLNLKSLVRVIETANRDESMFKDALNALHNEFIERLTNYYADEDAMQLFVNIVNKSNILGWTKQNWESEYKKLAEEFDKNHFSINDIEFDKRELVRLSSSRKVMKFTAEEVKDTTKEASAKKIAGGGAGVEFIFDNKLVEMDLLYIDSLDSLKSYIGKKGKVGSGTLQSYADAKKVKNMGVVEIIEITDSSDLEQVEIKEIINKGLYAPDGVEIQNFMYGAGYIRATIQDKIDDDTEEGTLYFWRNVERTDATGVKYEATVEATVYVKIAFYPSDECKDAYNNLDSYDEEESELDTESSKKTADNTIRRNDTVEYEGVRNIVMDIIGDEAVIEQEDFPYEEKTVKKDVLVKLASKQEKKSALTPPPQPDNASLTQGMKWVFNSTTNAWEQKPTTDTNTVEVSTTASGEKFAPTYSVSVTDVINDDAVLECIEDIHSLDVAFRKASELKEKYKNKDNFAINIFGYQTEEALKSTVCDYAKAYYYKFHGKEASMKDIKRIVVNSKVITLDGMKIISKKKLHKLAKDIVYIGNELYDYLKGKFDWYADSVFEIDSEDDFIKLDYSSYVDNDEELLKQTQEDIETLIPVVKEYLEKSKDYTNPYFYIADYAVKLNKQSDIKTASTKTSATKDIEVISTGTGVLQIFEKGDKYDYSGIETGEQIYEFSTEGMELIVDDIQNDKYYNIQFDTYDALTNFVNSIQHADTKQEISDLLKSNTASQKTATIKRNIMNKKALDSWVSEDNYMGEDYSDYYIVYTQTRDSEALERSNFKKALEMLGGESDDVLVARSGHWAVGWVETLLVKKDNAEKVKIAEEIEKQIGEYPVLDEKDYSDAKMDEISEYVDQIDSGEIKQIYDEISPKLSASSLTIGDKTPKESEIMGWIKSYLMEAVEEQEMYNGEVYVGDEAKKFLIKTINEQIAEYNKQKESNKVSGIYFGIRKQANNKTASAFDKMERIDIIDGYYAMKDKEGDITIKDSKGKTVDTYPDAFGDDVAMIMAFFTKIYGKKDNKKDSKELENKVKETEEKIEKETPKTAKANILNYRIDEKNNGESIGYEAVIDKEGFIVEVIGYLKDVGYEIIDNGSEYVIPLDATNMEGAKLEMEGFEDDYAIGRAPYVVGSKEKKEACGADCKCASEEKPADEKALEEIANDKKADEESDNIDETTEKPADEATENADADKNITNDAVIADQLDKVVVVNELIKSTEGGKFAVDFVLMVNGNFIAQNKEFNTKEEAEDYKNKLVEKAKAKVKDNSVKEEEQAVASKEDIEKEKAEIQSQRKEIMAEKLRLELIKKSEFAKKLAREAYEKGAIYYTDGEFEEAVNVKMVHPIEASKMLEDNVIKIQAKKIMAMTDEQIKGFEMVVNSFKKVASVERKDLTLKTAFLNGDKGTKIFDDFEKELSRDTQSVEDAWAGILERAKSKK